MSSTSFMFQPTILDTNQNIHLVYKDDQKGKWHVGMNIATSPEKVDIELFADYVSGGFVASARVNADQFDQFKNYSNIKCRMEELSEFLKTACSNADTYATLRIEDKTCFLVINGYRGLFMLQFKVEPMKLIDYFCTKISEATDSKGKVDKDRGKSDKKEGVLFGLKHTSVYTSPGLTLGWKAEDGKDKNKRKEEPVPASSASKAKGETPRHKEKADKERKEHKSDKKKTDETKREESQPAKSEVTPKQYKTGGWDDEPALVNAPKEAADGTQHKAEKRKEEPVPASTASKAKDETPRHKEKAEKKHKEEKSVKKEKTEKKREEGKDAMSEVRKPAMHTGESGNKSAEAGSTKGVDSTPRSVEKKHRGEPVPASSASKAKDETPRHKEKGEKKHKEDKSGKKETAEKRKEEPVPASSASKAKDETPRHKEKGEKHNEDKSGKKEKAEKERKEDKSDKKKTAAVKHEESKPAEKAKKSEMTFTPASKQYKTGGWD